MLARRGRRLLAGDPTTLALLTEDEHPDAVQGRADRRHRRRRRCASSTRRCASCPTCTASSSRASRSTSICKLKGFVGLYTLILSIVLLFAAILLIWNTIRTAMFARRREIEVMKLVGATDWFIRIPFMLEGLIQGFIGGAVRRRRRCG